MLPLIQILGRQSRAALASWGFAVVGAIAALAYVAGPGLAVPVLYVLPAAVVAWFAGRAAGTGVGVTAAVLWTAVDVAHAGTGSDLTYWNAVLRLFVLVGLAQLVAGLNTALRYARTDYLTGIANGPAFHDEAQTELARSRRYGSPFTVVYLDVDDIHAVNQRFGHSVGDAMIRSLAVTLRRSLRSSDLVARLGADDFAILLPETGPEAAQGVLRKLETVLRDAAQKAQWASSLSIGGVTFTKAPESVEGALHRAEDMMSAAKKADRKALSVRWQLEGAPAEGLSA
jgi:diguanylate cyclase (GGDEF)-like protein